MTDAHLSVGTLDATSGAVPCGLDAERARDAIRKRIAEPLGWDTDRAAHAILRLATATMAETVRLVTVRRGIDIRDFVLVAYGGAGPMHAAAIAHEVGISTIVVPDYPAMFSALGSIMCDIRHDLVHSVVRDVEELPAGYLATVFDGLRGRARTLLAAESAHSIESTESGSEPTAEYRRLVDLRYRGQLHHIAVPVPGDPDAAQIESDFRDAYRAQYGYVLPEGDIELVNARLEVVLPRWQDGRFPSAPAGSDRGATQRTVRAEDGTGTQLPVLSRQLVVEREVVSGPALIVDDGAVTPVRAGWSVRPLAAGAIVLEEDA